MFPCNIPCASINNSLSVIQDNTSRFEHLYTYTSNTTYPWKHWAACFKAICTLHLHSRKTLLWDWATEAVQLVHLQYMYMLMHVYIMCTLYFYITQHHLLCHNSYCSMQFTPTATQKPIDPPHSQDHPQTSTHKHGTHKYTSWMKPRWSGISMWIVIVFGMGWTS